MEWDTHATGNAASYNRATTTTYTYDAANRLTKVTDTLGKIKTYTYDALGNRLTYTDQLSNTTTNTYDAAGKLLTTKDPLNNSVNYSYDANGNRISMTDPKGNATTYTYDELNRLLKVTDSSGNTTNYSYDANGNRTALVSPAGKSITYTFDALNRMLTEKDETGKTTTLTYDANGNVATRKDALNNTISYTYDALNRLTKKRYPDTSTVTYTLDANGNRTQMADAAGTSTFVYDTLNRMTAKTGTYSQAVSYTYDKIGNVLTIVYPGSKTVTYSYDTENRLSKVTDWLNNQTSYTYNDAGDITQIAYFNGTYQSFSYDAARRPTGMALKKSADNSVIESISYTLDKNGNRTDVTQTSGITTNLTAGTTTYTVDIANRVTADGSATYQYNALGNMTSKTINSATTNYTYNYENHLKSVGNVTYTMDGDNNRLSDGANRFVLDTRTGMSQVLMDMDTSNTPTAYYIYGSGLLTKIDSAGNAYLYQHDLSGNVKNVLDSSGTVKNSYNYDPFGKILSKTENINNRYTFVGKFGVSDDGTGLYYMRNRYYDKGTGQFTSKDKIYGDIFNPLTLHKYAYVLNDPVNLIDPNGLDGSLTGEDAGSKRGPKVKPYYPKNPICSVANCPSDQYYYPSDFSGNEDIINEANKIFDLYNTIPALQDSSSLRTITAWDKGLQVLKPHLKPDKPNKCE